MSHLTAQSTTSTSHCHICKEINLQQHIQLWLYTYLHTFLHAHTHIISSIHSFLSISNFVIYLSIPISQNRQALYILSYRIHMYISKTRMCTCMHMCVCSISSVFVSVFPLYSHYRTEELLVSFYSYTLTFPFPILLLLVFRFSLVYSYLSLSYIVWRTYHGVRCLYSYIYYLSIYLCTYIFLNSYSYPYSYVLIQY